jgi:2-oxoisovalerate dehydrogenase E1 component alpha subunit
VRADRHPGLHAAGAALAFKLRKRAARRRWPARRRRQLQDRHLRRDQFAGAYALPFVQCIINNQWAISVPRRRRPAPTLAQKGIAGGLDCVQVDGNDLVAVRAAMRLRARARARGGGGSVIERSPIASATTPPPTTHAAIARRGSEGRVGSANR